MPAACSDVVGAGDFFKKRVREGSSNQGATGRRLQINLGAQKDAQRMWMCTAWRCRCVALLVSISSPCAVECSFCELYSSRNPQDHLWSCGNKNMACELWIRCVWDIATTHQYLEFCLHYMSFFFVFPGELFILVVITHQHLRLRIHDEVLLGSQRQTTVQTRPNTS